jgi:hypothetical protein
MSVQTLKKPLQERVKVQAKTIAYDGSGSTYGWMMFITR